MIDNEKLTRWYDVQARFYSSWRDRGTGGHVQQVVASFDAERPLEIADIGCGTGLFAVELAAGSATWKITGIDASQGMLDVAADRAKQRQLSNVSWKRGDAYSLPFADGSFDVVVASGLFPNLNDHNRALQEFARVLRPEGQLVVVEVDREALRLLDRAFFHTMIFGYRIVSTLMPRYKFARGWSLEKTTVLLGSMVDRLQRLGFSVARQERIDKHWIVSARFNGNDAQP